LHEAGMDSRTLGSVKIATIGPATTNSVWERLSVRVDYEPAEAVAEAALAQWPDSTLAGSKVLVPCGSDARNVLPKGLRAIGAEVDVVAVYDTVVDSAGGVEMLQMLDQKSIDALTFTSSSTVNNFMKATGLESAELKRQLGGTVIAAIGPVTAQTLRESGFEPHVIADEHTINGLVSALELHFAAAVVGSIGARNG
jgi:uroporphyrinogen III methyltransferase/synthase